MILNMPIKALGVAPETINVSRLHLTHALRLCFEVFALMLRWPSYLLPPTFTIKIFKTLSLKGKSTSSNVKEA